MQHDEVIWQVINQNFCSFKVKTERQNFCKNEHNITGLCNRSSCPLANSRYCTIQEKDGILYLCIKTIERAHTPKNMWEKIKLSNNYARALEQIDENLQFWPKFLVHKAKQRLTKITQYLIKMRKLKLKVQPTLVGIHKKIDRREKVRASRAEKAAKIEDAIKKELVDRLRQGTYEGIVNFPSQTYQEVLSEEEITESEQEDDEEAPPEEVDDEDDEIEFVEGYEDEDEEDLEDLGEYEFEEEREAPLKATASASAASSKRKQPSSGKSAFDGFDFADVDDDDDVEADDEDDDDENVPQSKRASKSSLSTLKRPKAHVEIQYDDEDDSSATPSSTSSSSKSSSKASTSKSSKSKSSR